MTYIPGLRITFCPGLTCTMAGYEFEHVWLFYLNSEGALEQDFSVYQDIKSRWDKGDEHVVKTLKRIADIAEEGKEAIHQKNRKKLNDLIDENFDRRSQIMNISDSNMQLVQTARKCGASAKFTGSGGSIIGIYTDDEVLTKLVVELKKIKARVIKPYII